MSRHARVRFGTVLCAGLMLQACLSAPPPAATPAVFRTAPQDAEAVRGFAREQERQVRACPAVHACDRAHYVRALAALYEDRMVAVKHFRAAASAAPSGPYAESSRLWIRLLEENRSGPGRDADLLHAAERVVREVLEREAAVRTAVGKQEDGQAVHELKRQLKEREKKIDELTNQIDALMRVDQEVKDRIKPSRPAD